MDLLGKELAVVVLEPHEIADFARLVRELALAIGAGNHVVYSTKILSSEFLILLLADDLL